MIQINILIDDNVIPDGYKPIAYRKPKHKELILQECRLTHKMKIIETDSNNHHCPAIILEKIK